MLQFLHNASSDLSMVMFSASNYITSTSKTTDRQTNRYKNLQMDT